MPTAPLVNGRSTPRKLIFWLLLAVLLIVVLWLGWKVVRVATAARTAMVELRALQQIDLQALSSLQGASGPAGLVDTVTELRDRFASLETSLQTIDREAGAFLPLARGLGWLPGIGADAQAAPELFALANHVATAGRAAMDGAAPVLSALDVEADEAVAGSALSRVARALAETASQWQEAEAALELAGEARAGLDIAALDPRLAGPLERLDSYLPLLRAGTGLASLTPLLLGTDQPRTYLLLAQNSDELRATGGFISGVGEITFTGGDIEALSFQDSYAVYDQTVDHPPAPPPLERYMKAQMLLLRDANWSPDFATTAAVARALYALDTGKGTDGVVAFDVEAARRLVAALQPLNLPGYQEPVTGDNLITAMRAVWAAPDSDGATDGDNVGDYGTTDWWEHRKDFMGDLAAAARAKIESGQVDFGALASALYSALEEKHLLVYLAEPSATDALSAVGWSGGIQPGGGDYLFVVDSNVGWNKVNSLVERRTNYRVVPGGSLGRAGQSASDAPSDQDGLVTAQLDLTYIHSGKALDGPCVHELIPYQEGYEDFVYQCYFDYLRVYVPSGARLLSADGFEPDTVETFSGERNTTVFAGFLVVPPGSEKQVRLSYELPASAVSKDSYRLLVQKQAGTPPWPVEVTLLQPEGEAGAEWELVSPQGLSQRTPVGLTVSFRLRTDTLVEARPVAQVDVAHPAVP